MRPKLLSALPHCLKLPWLSDLSEIRILDHHAKDLDYFKSFLSKYSGDKPPARFKNPEVARSGDVRLSHRSMKDLVQYCLNYIGADPSYSEESRNCQTFAADFFSFLCASPSTQPFYPLNRLLYERRADLFLYEQDHT